MSDTLEVITSDPAVPLESLEEHRNDPPPRLWQRLGLGAVTLSMFVYNEFIYPV